MFNSPYDTKTASWVKVAPLQAAMKTAKIEQRLVPATVGVPHIPDSRAAGPTTQSGLYYLTSGPTGNTEEPAFSNPVIFTDTLGKLNIVADMRTMLTYEQGVLVVRNRNAMMDCQQQIIRMKTMWQWCHGREKDLLNISSLGMQVYARWLTEGISRKLGLDYGAIPRLMTYAAYFYYSQFYAASDIDPMMVMKKIADHTRINTAVVTDVVNYISEYQLTINSLDLFVKHAKEVVGAEELALLDAKMLIAASGYAWVGMKSEEASGIAIEYPPYFLSILYGSMNNNLYKNTAIGRILDRSEFRKVKAEFERNFVGIITE